MKRSETLKLRMIVDNVASILAIELLTATQALEFSKPLQPGAPLQKIYARVRELVPFVETDMAMSPLIETLKNSLREIYKF
jgi:histidine ammonia-lyase